MNVKTKLLSNYFLPEDKGIVHAKKIKLKK